jgi:hypothetical protein
MNDTISLEGARARLRGEQEAPPPASEDDYGGARAPQAPIGDDVTADASSTVQLTPTPFAYRDPSKIPHRQFVYSRHLIRGFVSATVAPAGLGKSSLELADCIAMASGRDLLGIKPPRPLRVWYVNLEDPCEEIERRVAAICLHFDVPAAELGDRLFVDGRETEIVIAHQLKAGVQIVKPLEEALITALLRAQIDVLTLDPFVSTHRVSENDNTAIDAVAKTFARIAGKANCAIEFVHHVRKTGGAEITAEDGRGASALVAAARSVRVLNPMSEKEAQDSGVGDLRRFHFRSDNGKANLAPPSTKATWYKIHSVPLHNGTPDAPFDDGDHVGVVTPWHWPDAFRGVTVSDLRRVQGVIANGRWRENAQAKDWVGLAVAKVLGLNPDGKADKARIGTMLKTWIKNGALVIVEGLDEKRKPRSYIEVGALADD